MTQVDGTTSSFFSLLRQKSDHFIRTPEKIITFILFAALLLSGLTIYKDFGLSWDEDLQRNYGSNVLEYVKHGNPDQLTRYDLESKKYYGPFFEVLLLGLEKLSGVQTSQAIYQQRHLITFLFYFIGAVFFYFLSKRLYGNWLWSILAVAMLVLHPRLFSHAFYNSKDIPFLVLFIISIYTLIRYLDKKNSVRAMTHALACALLIDVRILGVLVPALTASLVSWDYFQLKKEIDQNKKKRHHHQEQLKKLTKTFIIYTMLTIIVMVIFWPTLWSNPIGHFITALNVMKKFDWPYTVLYFGQYYKGTAIPWHYMPVWMVISSPIVVLSLALVGLPVSIKSLLKGGLALLNQQWETLIVLVWFAVPVLAVTIMHAVLYDGWRQMFFVYPALVLIAIKGLDALQHYLEKRLSRSAEIIKKSLLPAIVVVGLVYPAVFIIQAHPHQSVFFNALVGGLKGAQDRFDMEYWGNSYLKGLQWILQHDSSDHIKIYADNYPGRSNADLLSEPEKRRLHYVGTAEEATYILSNYRWRKSFNVPWPNCIYSIKISGVPILGVYQNRPLEKK